MIYRQKSEPKYSEQFVYFLVQREEKKVYIDLTSSKEPSTVLRKHWRGEDKDTREIFSRENPKAKPVMWLWDAGYLTRKKAKVFVLEWEKLFAAEGYKIVGTKISASFRRNSPEISDIEMYSFRKVSVSGLMNGSIGWRVECSAEGGEKLSPYQKFTTEPTDETLRIQVREDTAEAFRAFCRKEGLTHGQGLELLLAEHTGLYDTAVYDLRERLIKANEELEARSHKIKQLQEAVIRAAEDKPPTKKYRMVELQSMLLLEFFRTFPPMEYPKEMIMKPFSFEAGQREFPQGREYSFPAQEGIIYLRIEHLQYSKTNPACLFVYGQDPVGNKIKIRWYSARNIKFGETLLDSPFLLYRHPWILAVQQEGTVMELVGSLPDFSNIFYDSDEEPTQAEVQDKERDYEIEGRSESTMDPIQYEVLLDENASLDERIRAARGDK